jgi:hypothetical protein
VGRQVFLPTLRPIETEYSEKAVPNATTWSTHLHDRSDHPLGKTILPRRAWRNGFITDAHASDAGF